VGTIWLEPPEILTKYSNIKLGEERRGGEGGKRKKDKKMKKAKGSGNLGRERIETDQRGGT